MGNQQNNFTPPNKEEGIYSLTRRYIGRNLEILDAAGVNDHVKHSIKKGFWNYLWECVERGYITKEVADQARRDNV